MKIENRRWPFVALGAGFLILGLLHLLAWLVIVFIYHANTISEVAGAYFSVYGSLGASGNWLFLATIFLDLAAAFLLLTSRIRGRSLILLTACLNLPIIPFGTVVGAAALLILFVLRRADS